MICHFMPFLMPERTDFGAQPEQGGGLCVSLLGVLFLPPCSAHAYCEPLGKGHPLLTAQETRRELAGCTLLLWVGLCPPKRYI